MAVITLSRELGSRGDDVAVALAARLGLTIAGRDVINRAARAAGAPEVALAEIDELGLLGLRPSAAALKEYVARAAAVIEELAEGGNALIVGRAGQVVLRDRADVFHLRIVAPVEQRIGVVMKRCRIGREAAGARVAASDLARAAFLDRNYRRQVNDPLLYDLVLNMAFMTVSGAVDTICTALSSRSGEDAVPTREDEA